MSIRSGRSRDPDWLDEDERQHLRAAIDMIGRMPTDEPHLVVRRIEACLVIVEHMAALAFRYACSHGKRRRAITDARFALRRAQRLARLEAAT
jgi:hypothetical protein